MVNFLGLTVRSGVAGLLILFLPCAVLGFADPGDRGPGGSERGRAAAPGPDGARSREPPSTKRGEGVRDI